MRSYWNLNEEQQKQARELVAEYLYRRGSSAYVFVKGHDRELAELRDAAVAQAKVVAPKAFYPDADDVVIPGVK
jgi:hypothetical protein